MCNFFSSVIEVIYIRTNDDQTDRITQRAPKRGRKDGKKIVQNASSLERF